MEHSIAILFYTRINRKNKNNHVPVYLRVTVNRKRLEQATGRTVDRSQWLPAAGRIKGNSPEAKALNGFLDAMRSKVHSIERAMILDGIEITYGFFKQRWFGVKQDIPTLLQVFKQHNEELALLAGRITHLLRGNAILLP